MTKLKLLFIVCLLIALKPASAQSYELRYFIADADSGIKKDIGLVEKFNSQAEARSFISSIPALLQTKGYLTASVDSAQIDSSSGLVHLFLGLQYKWAKIRTRPHDQDVLSAVRWPQTSFANSGLDWASVKNWQDQIVTHLENNGYPFAKGRVFDVTEEDHGQYDQEEPIFCA